MSSKLGLSQLKNLTASQKEEINKAKERKVYEDNIFEYGEDLKDIKWEVNQQLELQHTQGVRTDDIMQYQTWEDMYVEFHDEYAEYVKDDLNYSTIDDRALKDQVIKKIMNQRMERQKLGFFSKFKYFKKLFPVIREEKPGKDLYAYIVAIQLLIAWFIVGYYTDVDRTEGIQGTSNAFSGNMVLVLIIWICFILIERCVNRTNTYEVERRDDIEVASPLDH